LVVVAVAAGGNPDVADLQVAVDGLLQFMRIKGGQGPNELGLRVEPSLDVTDFYGAQSTVNATAGGGPAVINTNAIGAPSTTPRRYLSISGSVTIGAAAGTYLNLAVGFRTNGVFTYVAALPVVPVVGGVYRVAVWLGGYILPAQAEPGLVVNGNAGGADHQAALDFTYQRLDGLP
jgi:hypothetical protein